MLPFSLSRGPVPFGSSTSSLTHFRYVAGQAILLARPFLSAARAQSRSTARVCIGKQAASLQPPSFDASGDIPLVERKQFWTKKIESENGWRRTHWEGGGILLSASSADRISARACLALLPCFLLLPLSPSHAAQRTLPFRRKVLISSFLHLCCCQPFISSNQLLRPILSLLCSLFPPGLYWQTMIHKAMYSLTNTTRVLELPRIPRFYRFVSAPFSLSLFAHFWES